MEITLYNYGANKSPTFTPNMGIENLYEGFKNIGVKVHRIERGIRPKTKNIACWGYKPHTGRRWHRNGFKTLVIELGYIGNRRVMHSLAWNGLNNYGTAPTYPDDGGERFRAHGGKILPWKRNDEGYIVIMGQVFNDSSLNGVNVLPIYMTAAAKAAELHGKKVYFRPHPVSVEKKNGILRVPGIENIEGSFDSVLRNAYMTVAYNSNACLDSILAGIPCVALDKGTMAYDLCSHSLNNPRYFPDREKAVHQIAYRQWSSDEIRSGEPLKKLLEMDV